MVVRAAGNDSSKLLGGKLLGEVARELLEVAAKHGKDLLGERNIQALVTKLTELLDAGLVRASKELGHRLDRGSLPPALAALLAAWARGEIAVLDPEDSKFKRLFAELAEAA